MSDKVFKGRRAPATILFMALTLVAVIVYWLNRNGPLWIDYAALIAIGFLIYGPIMIIGLHALDLVPKKAAGTAAGFTGFFGYVFGSAIAGTGVGWIADHWGWNGVFVDDGRLLPADDRLQRDDARPQGAQSGAPGWLRTCRCTAAALGSCQEV